MTWLFLLLIAAQQPGTVEGTVINSITHEPVRKATVMLRSRDARTGTNYAAETDASGRFSFQAVEAGAYTATTDRLGFSTETPGAPPRTLIVATGQSIKDYTIRLIPQSVITGHILDEDGDPVRGFTVELQSYSYNSGKRQLTKRQSTSTGNHGEYRFLGLQPGTYYVKAASRDRSATFYPSAIDPSEAAPLKLTAGSEFRNIDVTLRKVHTYSLSGAFPDDPAGQVLYLLDLTPRIETVNQSRDGHQFTFRGLRDGAYVLTALRSEGNRQTFAYQNVTVSGADVTGIDLSFQPSKEVRGQLRFEGKDPPEKPATIRVTLKPNPQFQNVADTAQLNPDGTFLFQALPPAMVDVSVSRVPGAYLKTVQLGDTVLPDRRFDLSRTNGALTITMGTDTAELEGKAREANGEPAARARVTVIAYGANLGRADLERFGFTADDGAFHIKDIAPGEYKVFAWESVEIGALQDPEFRRPFESSGVPIKLEPNGHATVSLTTVKTLVN